MARTTAELIDKLDWRLRLLAYGLDYMGREAALAEPDKICDDLGLLVLEMRQILEEASTEDKTGGGGHRGRPRVVVSLKDRK